MMAVTTLLHGMEKHNKSRCESKYFESFGSIKISVYRVFTRTICNDLSSQNLSSCTIGQGVPLLNDLTIGQKTFPRICVIQLQSHSDHKTLKPLSRRSLLVPLEANVDSPSSLSVQNHVATLRIFRISLQDPSKKQKKVLQNVSQVGSYITP